MMKKKYIVMGIIAVFLLGAYVMDAIRANSYEYELVDTSALLTERCLLLAV